MMADNDLISLFLLLLRPAVFEPMAVLPEKAWLPLNDLAVQAVLGVGGLGLSPHH